MFTKILFEAVLGLTVAGAITWLFAKGAESESQPKPKGEQQ